MNMSDLWDHENGFQMQRQLVKILMVIEFVVNLLDEMLNLLWFEMQVDRTEDGKKEILKRVEARLSLVLLRFSIYKGMV